MGRLALGIVTSDFFSTEFLHSGAITGHFIGRFSDGLTLRSDHARGVNLYAFEIPPGIYPQILAFLFYRREVIIRETAILGIHTLGFFVDNALADLRFDRAMVLILITACLNVAVDALSRFIRQRQRLKTTPDQA